MFLVSKSDRRYIEKKKKVTELSALLGQDSFEEFFKNEKADGIGLKGKIRGQMDMLQKCGRSCRCSRLWREEYQREGLGQMNDRRLAGV